MKRQMGLACLWFVTSLFIAPIGWGLAGGLFSMVHEQSIPDAVAMFVSTLLFGPLYAIIIVAMFAPAYACVYLLWPLLAGWLPWIERNRVGIVATSFVLAAPAASIVASSRAQFGELFRWGEFCEWFLMATLAVMFAMVAPRLILRSLAPGAFAQRAGT
jgi:hypothetical protein